MKSNISVVIPAYDEALVIGNVVRQVQAILATDERCVEVLVVDDGSTDDTASIAAAAGAQVIRQPYNKGNGAAVKAGIRAARGDIIVLMDGDGQHDAADIPRLAAPIIEDGYDMVVGARVKGSQEWRRQLANSFYDRFASYLTGFPIEDLTSGFRVIRRKLALQFCYLLPNTFSYPTTLTIAIVKAGYSLKYEPIHAAQRVGKSKIKLLRDGLRFLVIMIRIATLFSPLKVFLPIGLAMFFPGFFYAIYKLIIGSRWTIPIVISISVGTLIMMMGLLAEQITLLRFQQIDR
jgi:glycosyltransferase involved in cell wall biosynthesis